MAKVKKVFYVDPKELKLELIEYKKNGMASEVLGEMLLKIAKRYASRPNFSGYSYKDEFISDAVFRMVEQLDKIDLNHPKCNPFAYLTLTCHRKFISKITQQKKYEEAKNKLKDHFFAEFEQNEGIIFKKNAEDSDNNFSQLESNE